MKRLLPLVVLLPAIAFSVTTFTRKESFFPLKMSYPRITRVLQRAQDFLNRANGAAKFSSEITASRGQQTVEMSDVREIPSAAESLPLANDFVYSYRCFEAPSIGNVTLRLGDFERTVIVSGPAQEQVAALHAMLTDELRSEQTYIGGATQRSIAGAILFMVGVTLTLFVSRAVDDRRTSQVISWSGLVLVTAMWLLPWQAWLPGTTVYAANPSFAAQYSAEISLAGLIVTILAFVVGTWLSIRYASRHERSRSAEPTDADV